MLPKKNDLIRNGGVYRQMVRCGKAGCRCARGDKHEAFYFISRNGKRQTKLYIPKPKLEEVREAVDSSREHYGTFRRSIRESTEVMRSFREFLRDQREFRNG